MLCIVTTVEDYGEDVLCFEFQDAQGVISGSTLLRLGIPHHPVRTMDTGGIRNGTGRSASNRCGFLLL